jgi:hypothetical protein
MIFMSFGMDLVWGLYLMLQIAGNLINFDDRCFIPKDEEESHCPKSILKIPANC